VRIRFTLEKKKGIVVGVINHALASTLSTLLGAAELGPAASAHKPNDFMDALYFKPFF
jgi:hypothetical protein